MGLADVRRYRSERMVARSKPRVCLVHWRAAEAAGRVARLVAAGYRVDLEFEQGGKAARNLKENPPQAVVIDLSRLPSHGRHLAVWLREQKATRRVPIVFVDGDPDKVARLEEAIPDAVYTSWSRIRGSLRRAIARPPQAPVVPQRPDYSGTPLPKKLGLKQDGVLALLGPPPGFERALGELPPGVSIRNQARGKADVIVLFARSETDLVRRFPAAHRALAEGGGLWIAWPKKASGIATDLTQSDVQRIGLDSGLVDNKVCAIDATWSGLRFMRRRK